MDSAALITVARQCVLSVGCGRDDVILYGSSAADRYITAPCMRFGESGTHQDIDLFLTSSEVSPDVLDEFLESVRSAFYDATEDSSMIWNVSMVFNGLYCARVFVRKMHHVCDVTLISKDQNAKIEAKFPRKKCVVCLPDLSSSLNIISFEEVLHRMAGTVAGVPLADGLPCLPTRVNAVAVTKNSLRLERLKLLETMGLISKSPAPIVLPASLDTLGCKPPAVVVDGPSAVVMPVWEVTRLTEVFSSSVSAVESHFESKLSQLSNVVTTLSSKLQSAEARGRQLASALNAMIDRDSEERNALNMRIAEEVKEFRTSAFLAAHAPLKTIREMHKILSKANIIATTEAGASDPCLGNYLDAYIVITEKMAKLNQFPFNLFPDVNLVHHDISSTSREACAITGMKMNIMASFTVFLRMLQLGSADNNSEQKKFVIGTYEDWSDKPSTAVVAQVASRVEQLIKEKIVTPREVCVPLVSAVDGHVDFLVMKRGSALREDKETITAVEESLRQSMAVPSMEKFSTEFMMHLLDNVIGSITCPLLGHVGQLQGAMQALSSLLGDSVDIASKYMDEAVSRASCVQQQTLKTLQDELLSSITCPSPRFSWATVQKRSKKSRKTKKRDVS